MDFTSEKPTKPGRYNTRWERGYEECTVAIDAKGQAIVVFEDGCVGPVDHFDCEWQGPLEPEE